MSYKLVNLKGIDTSFYITGEYASERLIAEGFNDGIEIPTTYYTPSNATVDYNTISIDTSSNNELSEMASNTVEKINPEQDSNELNTKTEDVLSTLSDSNSDVGIQEIEKESALNNVEIQEEQASIAENFDNKISTTEEEKHYFKYC